MKRTLIPFFVSGSILALAPTASSQVDWFESAKLISPSPAFEYFGVAVSVDGNTALVGAPAYGTPLGIGRTYAYPYDPLSGTWGTPDALDPPPPPSVGYSGSRVSLSGNTAIVSDHGHNNWTGRVHVYVKSGTSWSPPYTIWDSQGAVNDEFGDAVAVDGDTIAVGAHQVGMGPGKVCTFQRNGVSWWQSTTVVNPTGQQDQFGRQVAISGNTLVVGAPYYGSGDAGRVYVYTRASSGSAWYLQQELPSPTNPTVKWFGGSLDVDGDRIAVACMQDWDAQDLPISCFPYVYVYEKNGATWNPAGRLEPSDWDATDGFGGALSVRGDKIVAGAPWEDRTIGDDDTGAAYLFEWNGVAWYQRARLMSSDGQQDDWFGISVSTNEEQAVVGALFADVGSVADAGAVYAFDLPDSPGRGYCFGDPGGGTPCPCGNDNDGSIPGSGCDNGVFASGAQLTGSGIASVTYDSLVLTTTHHEPNNSGLYFQADNDLSPGVVWGDGLQCAGGQLKRLGVRFADANGSSDTSAWATPISVKAGNVSAGDTKRYQCWYRTTVNPPCGVGVNDFNASNGYEVTWSL